jgi:hypothetical protein
MNGLEARVEIRGQAGVAAKIRAIAAENRRRAIAAAIAEWTIEMKESQARCPKLSGALSGTHRVMVRVDGDVIVATITVGGPDAPYAVFVHERLDVFHPIGQAKFLESTILESAPYMPRRLAARLEIG